MVERGESGAVHSILDLHDANLPQTFVSVVREA
jgi:hypothetical protein